MFDSLKKKLKSFFTAEPEKPKAKKARKKAKEKKPKKQKETKKLPSDKQLKEKAKKIKEEVPLEFNVALEKYEPDTEAIKEQVEEKIEPEEVKKGFFSRFTERFTSSKITKSQVEEIFIDLELILLENNVALEVVDKIKESLISKLVNTEVKRSDLQLKVISSLKDSISDILKDPPNLINIIKSKQEIYVILFFGINGSGKTKCGQA